MCASLVMQTNRKSCSAEVHGSPDEAAKDDKNVRDIQSPVDLPGLLLGRGHCAAHSGDVGVIPGVVVHQDCPVGHSRRLVAVVPPAHAGTCSLPASSSNPLPRSLSGHIY